MPASLRIWCILAAVFTLFSVAEAASSSLSSPHHQSTPTYSSFKASPTASLAPNHEAEENTKNKNLMIQLGQYLVDSFARAKDGTVQLYANHRRCNQIREKQRQYRFSKTAQHTSQYQGQGLGQGQESPSAKHIKPNLGITYDEFLFLQQGKEDRGKLANILFMMVFAPNFVPYAFMFFPDMLPSPFSPMQQQKQQQQQQKLGNIVSPEAHHTKTFLVSPSLDKNTAASSTGIYKYHDALSRQQTHVVVSTLLELEKNSCTASFWDSLNPFGKNKTKKKLDELDEMNNQVALFLTRTSNHLPLDSSSSTTTSTFKTSKQSWIHTFSSSSKLSSSSSVAAASHKSQSSSSSSYSSSYSTHDLPSKDVTSAIVHEYGSDKGPFAVMKTLQHKLYSKDIPMEKNEAQLVMLPKSILSGLDQLLSLAFTTPIGMSSRSRSNSGSSNSNAFLTSLLPKFILRGKVLNYLKQIEEADEFLIDSKTNLNTLSKDILQSTCQKRLMGGPERTEQELRESLSTWLDCTVVLPRKRCSVYAKKSVSSSALVASTTATLPPTTTTKRATLYFNGNLARAALLCYNALEGARDSRNASYLPRLLFTGSSALQK